MAIARWEPLQEMRALTRRIERLFDPLANALEPYPVDPRLAETWPPVDVYEDKEEIVLRCELPGLERKQVEILVDDSAITLRGERRLERADRRENYHRIECSYGSFNRSFALPAAFDRDHIRAEMKDGVLRVTVPRKEGAGGRTIAVTG